MAYPRFQRARDVKVFSRTAGNLTLNSTTWADLPTIGTTWDVVLAAQVGDTIEAGASFFTGAEAIHVFFDAVTVVGGAVVASISGATTANTSQGASCWRGTASTEGIHGGSVMRALLVSDLSAGTVTVRLRYRSNGAVNRTFYSNTDNPAQFWVRNLGPMDPN